MLNEGEEANSKRVPYMSRGYTRGVGLQSPGSSRGGRGRATVKYLV